MYVAEMNDMSDVSNQTHTLRVNLKILNRLEFLVSDQNDELYRA